MSGTARPRACSRPPPQKRRNRGRPRGRGRRSADLRSGAVLDGFRYLPSGCSALRGNVRMRSFRNCFPPSISVAYFGGSGNVFALAVTRFDDRTVVAIFWMIRAGQEVLPPGLIFDFGLVCSYPEGGVCVVGVMHSAHLFFTFSPGGFILKEHSGTLTFDVRRIS